MEPLPRGHTANRPAPDRLPHLLLLGSPAWLWKWGRPASKGEESQRDPFLRLSFLICKMGTASLLTSWGESEEGLR